MDRAPSQHSQMNQPQAQPQAPAPVHHQDMPIGGALGDAMGQKYGGGHHQLGQGVTKNHQDMPIGGGFGEAMQKKHGAHHELGQGVKQNHQDMPIGGAFGDAM